MAALAAGVASSMAQSNVYSLNIVGYANVPNPVQYSFMSTPFLVTTAVTNGANEILPANTGQYDGDQVLLWTGVSYRTYGLDSTSPTGFSDSGGTPIGAPILTSGLGFLYNNQSGASNNLTFVGQVRTGTNALPLRASPIQLVGSMLPLSGGVASSLGLTNTAAVLDGCEIQKIVRTASGAVKGYSITVYDSSQTTGFSDRNGTPNLPEPQMGVGEGFFFNNQTGAGQTWTQILNP
jgi:hypothetical protein